jgi:hypothetical protein
VSQNSVIFAALVIGFIVYITIKGRLPAYLALFTTRQSVSTPGSPNPATPGSQPSAYGATPVPQVTTDAGTFDIPDAQSPSAPGSF